MIACPQRLALVRDWSRAVRVYSEAVSTYSDSVATGNNADREFTRMAWDASERARVALVRHRDLHRCET
jgi:hypothetical protein